MGAMNKYIYTILSLAIMCSCVRMEVLESSNIAGLWACMDNGEQANIFYRFENGTATRYESSERFTVAENTLWHCGETQFESFSAGGYRYSVEGDVVKIGDGGKSDGKFNVDGNTMEWNGVRYAKIDSMSESFYTSINVSNKTVPAQYKRSTVSVPYVIEHPISEGSMTAACLNEWVSNVVIGKDQLSFTAAENTGNERLATMTLRYPGAEDVVLTIVQESGTTEIVLPNSSVNTDYAAKTLSFAYSISCPHDGQSLSATCAASWISNINVSSREVSFKIADNNSEATREAEIRLSYPYGEGKEATTIFTVAQTYAGPTISLSRNSLEVDYKLRSNESFSFIISDARSDGKMSAASSSSWINSVAVSGDKVTFNIAENNSGDIRTGDIVLTYTYGGGKTVGKSFTVKQTYSGSVITTTPASSSLDYKAQNGSFTYSVSNPREGQSLSAISQDSWITGVTVSGTTVSYSVSDNNTGSSRTGAIKLTYGSSVKTFSVTQSFTAPVIILFSTKLEASYTAKTGQNFAYALSNTRSDGKLTATSSANWISSITVAAEKVTFNIAANYTGATRSEDIVLTYTYGGDKTVSKSFTVTQSPECTISITPESQSTDYSSKILSFTFSIDTPRQGVTASASSTESWISNIQVSGNTVSYKVAENNSGASRTGKITLTYGSTNREFLVMQSYSAVGITLTPESQSTDYASKNLSFKFSVSNPRDGVTATASTTVTWITDVQVSGSTVRYKVVENNSGATRTAKIKLTYGSLSKEFSVTQTYSAVGITLTPESQSTDYTDKRLSFTFSISNPRDGVTASASSTDSWITNILISDNTVSYEVAENNSGASRKGKIKLTYGSVSEEFPVTQTYTAPVISFTPESQITDYTSKTLSFTYSVDTPRQGVTASASSTDSWITNIQVSGNTVSYEVTENNNVPRTGKIKLTYAKTMMEFSVMQDRLRITNGYEYVDLGLSVKWSTCNVGASKPEDYGGYYQWAGIEDVKDTSNNLFWDNCPYHTGTSTMPGWTKYVRYADSMYYWSGTGDPDNKMVLDPEDDVAHIEWGGSWRMATETEWAELRNTSNCSWTWTTINGINGYKVKSKKSGYTSNWIFLPAAGYRYGKILFSVGTYGKYWSSSLQEGPSFAAYNTNFNSSGFGMHGEDRYNGESIRPVIE